MKKNILLIILIFLSSFFTFADENDSSTTAETETSSEEEASTNEKNIDNTLFKGEHQLCFALGLNVPMFTKFLYDNSIGDNGLIFGPDMYQRIPVGGMLGLDYKFAIADNFLVGGSLEGGLFSTTGGNTHTIAALSASFTYNIRRWPFDIPLSINIGAYLNTLKLKDSQLSYTSANIFIKPQFAFYWNINQDWAFGFNTSMWMLPEFYADEAKKNDAAMSFYWNFGLTARYRLKR
ncbi:MAG: hypothetical protein JXR63_02850 [Spirochaetales bacterium]|nr:hypothetical protein [Spirochaetales bacterium]